jgi:hypothetical protein
MLFTNDQIRARDVAGRSIKRMLRPARLAATSRDD